MTPAQIQRARASEERAHRFSEARHLMAFGIHPDDLCDRLGVTRQAFEIQARRWGARDIYEYVRQPREARYSGTCVDCDETIAPRAKRCRPCFERSRVAA